MAPASFRRFHLRSVRSAAGTCERSPHTIGCAKGGLRQARSRSKGTLPEVPLRDEILLARSDRGESVASYVGDVAILERLGQEREPPQWAPVELPDPTRLMM
jgi:hypothetical protein